MSKVHIIGACNTKFGAFTDKTEDKISDRKSLYALINEAAQGAVRDAGIDPADVDGIWLGTYAPALFTRQDHAGPLAVEAFPEAWRFKPTQRVEGACASSSMALLNAVYGVESGRMRIAVVIGAEKMTLLDTAGVTHALATASHWQMEGAFGMTFPGLFAEYAKGYMAHHGLPLETLRRMMAATAALNYRNALHNPLAHFGKGGPADRMQLFSADAIMALPDNKNPMIADPLRLHDCSLVTDGAAALVIASDEVADGFRDRSVRIAGIGHTSEHLAMTHRPNCHELSAAKHAVALAYQEAGITASDVNIAEVHDCFTINQLLCTEALGFARDGQSGHAYLEGRFGAEDHEVSINLSGGLKAKGHPVGATGASMHAMLYKQLTGRPVGLSRPGPPPEVAAVLNVGGSAATNAAVVLRRETG